LKNKNDQYYWNDIISSKSSAFDFKIKEMVKYKDLLFMLVKRDFISIYKQTILGPIWFFIQPIITTITFTIIFGNIAGISTDGLPHILFYMSGITCWNYFSGSLEQISRVFRDNQNVFGKVYFPRLIVPLSIVVSNLMKLSIQLILFVCVLSYYIFFSDVSISINSVVLLLPLLILIISGLALGFGLIITSLTNKYRDLIFLLSFGIQLAMYMTPVIYPLSTLSEKAQFWLLLNPLTSVIETFKFGFFGRGIFDVYHLFYSAVFMFFILFAGIVTFNKTEKNFMDTV